MILEGVSLSATVRTRTNLSLHHLLAAGRYAAQIAIVEQENDGKPLGPFWDEILQNSLGVVTLTVAALECYANELWFKHAPARPVNEAAAEKISELIDRKSVLTKYSLALSLYTGKSLEFGCEPVQNVDALIKLRNGVVHFRPEWFGSQARHKKLSKQLNGRFSSSQFFPNEPLFPRAWATGDFACWAIRSTVNFLDHFYSEAGLTSPLEKFKPCLEEVSSVAL
jgi:hypothetical protein